MFAFVVEMEKKNVCAVTESAHDKKICAVLTSRATGHSWRQDEVDVTGFVASDAENLMQAEWQIEIEAKRGDRGTKIIDRHTSNRSRAFHGGLSLKSATAARASCRRVTPGAKATLFDKLGKRKRKKSCLCVGMRHLDVPQIA